MNKQIHSNNTNYMKLNLKNNVAITLIALVITIILLLILAGVVINFVFNGDLIDKARAS